MKKSKFSVMAASAIIVASLSAFAPHAKRITAGWYGQTTDAVPPYSTSFPINAADLNTVCPPAQTHICAVKLKSDGTLDPVLPNTVRSTHNYQP